MDQTWKHDKVQWLKKLKSNPFWELIWFHSASLYAPPLTLTPLDLTKSYRNYLQNTQHVVLRNRPTLPIGAERLACLNSPHGVQLGTLAYHAAGPGFEPLARRARCARFFSTLPSFLLREIVFCTFPTKPVVRLGLTVLPGL